MFDNIHRLLMPPHPGDVYNSSALCSCGEWQYDGVNQYNLFNAYRTVLREHTLHMKREASLNAGHRDKE